MTSFTLPTERYKTFRTEQNFRERDKTFFRFCLVLIRTARTFCEVLSVLGVVLVGSIELPYPFWNVLRTLIVLQYIFVLYSYFGNKQTKPGQVNTVSFKVPIYHYGQLVKYLELK